MRKHFTALTFAMIILILVGAGCTTQQPTATPVPPTEVVVEPTVENTVEVPASGTDTETAQLELTLEELAEYDGKDGRPAYVAIDGVIYDVTDNPKWNNGSHQGNSAGKDLTEELKSRSPHGTTVLSNLPVVGKIVE